MTKRNQMIKLLILSLLLVFSLTSCTNDTSYPGTMNVVEASKVVEDLASNPDVIVIDAREEEAYNKGHVDGAICLTHTELSTDQPVSMMLPSKEQLEKTLGGKGISNDSVIYVYDDNQGIFAARIWWTLRVFGHENVMIVNGGSNALVKANAPLAIETTTLPTTEYVAKDVDLSTVATYDDMVALAENPVEGVVILDVRSLAEYQAGYIPGAILYPHTKNVYSDDTFMSSRDLGLFYKEAGIKKEDTIIIYCKSSVRATQTMALLQEAGYENLKVYDGAWLEWETKTDVIVPVEEVAPVGPSDGS